MAEIIPVFFYALLAAVFLMVGGWLISLKYQNVTIADTLWGVGFPLLAWVVCFMSDSGSAREMRVAILVSAWGLRLAAYLSWRNWGKGEDPRYQKMRARAGNRFWVKSLFSVFLLQACLMWVISWAMTWAQAAPGPAHLTLWDIAGLIFWGVGFFFQTVGDLQLAAFKARPESKGKVMNQGLWAYTRHPNYFGESLMWWGIFFMATAVPGGWWTVISPVAITFLLLKVSGIPMTERVISTSRPGYAAYVRNTSSFFPWFPKSKKNKVSHEKHS